MTLSEIIEIHELMPHKSVEGITREKIMPHDALVIDGREYRVNFMERIGKNTKFQAILK
jgi:hypothetical protein